MMDSVGISSWIWPAEGFALPGTTLFLPEESLRGRRESGSTALKSRVGNPQLRCQETLMSLVVFDI